MLNSVREKFAERCLFSGNLEKREKKQKPLKRRNSELHGETRNVISMQNLGFGKVCCHRYYYIYCSLLLLVMPLC